LVAVAAVPELTAQARLDPAAVVEEVVPTSQIQFR
jgi:hypothetical protein